MILSRQWRRRKMIELHDEGGAYWDWTFKRFVITLVCRPGQSVRYWYTQAMRRWLTLPGDRWEDFQMDETYEITEVKRDYCMATVHRNGGRVYAGTIKAYRKDPETRMFFHGTSTRSMERWTLVRTRTTR